MPQEECYRCKKPCEKDIYMKVINKEIIYFCSQDCEDIITYGFPVLRDY
jgi:hypothetical protein